MTRLTSLTNTDYYEKLRIIKQSNESGSEERVYFTEDFDTPIEELTISGLTVDSDVIIEGIELPSGFPLDYDLIRE
jgi:hypothetical protein